jgi:hypothetical protein
MHTIYHPKKLSAKGRKASLAEFTLYSESSVFKANTKGLAKRVKLAKHKRRKRQARVNSRTYLGQGQYVDLWQGDKRETPFEYTPICELHLGFKLSPRKDALGQRLPGFDKLGGKRFRADHAPMALLPCKAWLRKAFLAWAKRHGFGGQWRFHFTTSVSDRTITMAVEPVL